MIINDCQKIRTNKNGFGFHFSFHVNYKVPSPGNLYIETVNCLWKFLFVQTLQVMVLHLIHEIIPSLG